MRNYDQLEIGLSSPLSNDSTHQHLFIVSVFEDVNVSMIVDNDLLG